MNYAFIIAGGSGNRMGQDIPKQFMHVDNCPIIIHTMKAFQQHPDINGIAVVCLTGWETVLQSYANQFMIDKLKWIFPGGANGQESIHNGIYGLKEAGCQDDDLVLIHDAVRPRQRQKLHGLHIDIFPYEGKKIPFLHSVSVKLSCTVCFSLAVRWPLLAHVLSCLLRDGVYPLFRLMGKIFGQSDLYMHSYGSWFRCKFPKDIYPTNPLSMKAMCLRDLPKLMNSARFCTVIS